MEQLAALINLCPPSTIPIIIVILGMFWIYMKTDNIEKARKTTKVERDKDNQDLREQILKLQFEMTNVKGVVDLHRDVLNDLQKQLGVIVNELTELNCTIRHLVEDKKKEG